MPTTSAKNTYSPGVYIEESNAFQSRIVGVQTAVPAFIGYTEKAERQGKPVFNQPISLSSIAEYETTFGGVFKHRYEIFPVTDPKLIESSNFDFKVADQDALSDGHSYYDLNDAEGLSQFRLYESMKLFFDNGGNQCYVISVGAYSHKNVQKAELSAGLAAAAEQAGPTILVIPDALSLPPTDPAIPYASNEFNELVQQMLAQCEARKDRVAILDIYGSQWIEPPASGSADSDLPDSLVPLEKVIDAFRAGVGSLNRSYGIAYFPSLETRVMWTGEISYSFLAESSYETFKQLLRLQNKSLNCDPVTGECDEKYQGIESYIDEIHPDNTEKQINELTSLLTQTLPVWNELIGLMTTRINRLSPGTAMAGVYTRVDAEKGVWTAPANIELLNVPKPSYPVSEKQLEYLNTPINGQAVNSIRLFSGRGTVVWGTRTLDGNNNDYRYVQVRRTLIYIEQSVRNGLAPFVFSANDGNTWASVIAMVSAFLQQLWSEGGLLGSTSDEAFTVECGLGSTMTGDDILNGYMIVKITLQMVRPAEFIELTIKQKMEG